MALSVIANVCIGNLEEEDSMTDNLLPSLKYARNIIYNYLN